MNLNLFIIENTVNSVKLRQYAKIHIAFVLQSCKKRGLKNLMTP